jgi:hypothetical protein
MVFNATFSCPSKQLRVGLLLFNTTFNNVSVTMYIVAISFIGGVFGFRSTRRKTLTSCKFLLQTLSHNVVLPEWDSSSQS